jgi:hypothetical protein
MAAAHIAPQRALPEERVEGMQLLIGMPQTPLQLQTDTLP